MTGAPSSAGLVRAIRRWDLVAMVINAIVGAGIFGLPSEAFRRIGVYSLLAFVACGLVVSLVVLCFAEVSSRFTETGGPYLYARAAFPPVVAFEVGWLLFIARITAFAANANLLLGYLGFFLPATGSGPWRGIILGVIVLLLTGLNLVGVRNAALAGNVFTVAKLVPLLLFVSAGLFFLRRDAFAAGAPPPLGEFSGSVLILVYAFSGFEMATIAGGEARDPRRDMPRALLIAIAVVLVLYLLIQVVAIGTLPGLGESSRPLADAGARFLGPMGAAVISAGALVSILGNLNVTLLVGSRLPFAMAERGDLPAFLGAVHPTFRTPHVAIVLTALVVLVLALTGTFVYAATVSTIARLLSYGGTCIALLVLRRRAGAPPAAFTVPGGSLVPLAALVLAGWLLTQSSARQARDAALAAAAGLLILFLARVARRAATR